MHCWMSMSKQCTWGRAPLKYILNHAITTYDIASFSGRSRLQILIAYSMQKRKGKAWEKESRA